MTRGVPGELADGRPRDYDWAVYINCPFDAEFGEYLDAIIFAVICCGLEPRSALALNNVSDTRVERIAQALGDCRLSIHDLSRLAADKKTGVARMNMSLELGIAMALHRSSKRQRGLPQHDWTALVIEGSAYKQALSDVNGNDLQRYKDKNELVAQVMSWLSPRMNDIELSADPTQVVNQLPVLDLELKVLRGKWFNKLPWEKLVASGRDLAQRKGLLPGGAPDRAGHQP